MEAFRRGDCDKALAGFERLDFTLPAQDERHAEVRYYAAECRLDQNRYIEAAREFRRVADEFPRHELAPDGLLRAGDAYTELWRTPELDPSYGEDAMNVYRELLGRYPESVAAQRARTRMAQLNEMFAEKEFKNGLYYLRLKAYDSALIYFKGVVANYPQSRYAPRAVLRMVEAYDEIGYREEKREMCQYLRQYYPDSASDAERCSAAPASP